MYGNRQPLAGGPQCRLPRCRGPDRPPGRLGAHRGLRRTTEATGTDGVLGTWGWLVVLLASLLVGLQVAVASAALQLGVVEALGRGSPRIALVRYVALTASVVVALGLATWVGVSVLVGETGVAGALLGGLIALAAFAVLVRSGRAFLTGFDAGT